MSNDRDDLEHALVELVRDQVAATTAQADAGGKLAAELSGLRGQLAILARVETALSDCSDALKVTRGLLVDLADRRAADVRALEDQHRREGYDKGYADAEKAHAASVAGAVQGGIVAWVGSAPGRMALGAILLLVCGFLATLIAPWVDMGTLAHLGVKP